ncbi:acetylcholine receptor subunit alpha-like [Saccostrea echinata]|uniref:acetylcholine receptor subunit alpha-like n=1 Tax=Saccostrea echinata TaxID=191078 RepID=UPI002A7EE0EF|nr:acetylcholine receptor subunit alpha-like [Saccostrea echinata]
MDIIKGFVIIQAMFSGICTESFEDHLFKNYTTLAKPRRNQSELVEVNVSMVIKTVLKVDERFQFISFYGWFNVQWKDEFLTWDANKQPGIKRINVPYKKVWRPDISLYYSEEHIHDLGAHPFVSITSQGHVTWFPGAKYTVQCHLLVKKFPFDEQKCSMVVGAWQTTDWMQKVIPRARSENDVEEITENGEWEFKRFTHTVIHNSEFDLTQIVYTLEFRRRYQYFILSTVMPVIILALMNSLTFLIPVASGERMAYCLTLFLTFTVFLTLFDQTMPRNSTDVPYITVFVAFHLFLCAISTTVSLITIKLNTEPETKILPTASSESAVEFLPSNAEFGNNNNKLITSNSKDRLKCASAKYFCRAVFLRKIDSIMLIMTFLILGLSTFVLIICYLS